MNIDEIKTLLKSGDIGGAEKAALEALENDKDNVRLLILYGACRQLLGDEATFRDTYATVKTALDGKEVEQDAVTAEEWNRFEQLYQQLDQPELLRKGDQPHGVLNMEYVVLALLIAVAVGVAVYWFGKSVSAQMDLASRAVYAGPPQKDCRVLDLYRGPRQGELIKEAKTKTWTSGGDVSNESGAGL